MSHETIMETVFSDMAILREACREAGFDVEVDTGCRQWGGQTVHCETVLRLSTGYDIGFRVNAEGKIEATADHYGLGNYEYLAAGALKTLIADNAGASTYERIMNRVNRQYQISTIRATARKVGAYNFRLAQDGGKMVVKVNVR